MNNKKPEFYLPVEKLDDKLRNLKSLIAHAREIENDAEAVQRLLEERSANGGVYKLDASLTVNLKHLKEMLIDSNDFHFRELEIAPLARKAAIVFLDGLVDKEAINNHIIERLVVPPVAQRSDLQLQDVLGYLKYSLLTAASINEVSTMAAVVKRLMTGDTILLVDGEASVLVIATRSVEYRSISEPETESAVRAPREGFVEGLRVNITMLRRRLRNPNLIVKRFTIGERSDTDIAVIYFRGIANTQLVCEVERRLKKINIDAPAGIGVVEGLIEDYPYSVFPTMVTTERPDKVASGLMEGKVGIIMDGTPFCLLAPGTLPDFFQTSDDYYEKWLAERFSGSSAMCRRFLPHESGYFCRHYNFSPGTYPTPLTVTIANARLGIPFPAFIEALIMETLLEILQEAGIRLPKTIGPAVSIVGGLVIGEATVRAGLISAPMVIVIAFTAIASFNVANYRINLLVRLLRIPFLILGATFGMFGVLVGLLAVGVHISLMESFGVPYLAPVIPGNSGELTDLKDTLVVVPPALMDERPAYLSPQDSKRQKR